MVTQKTYQFDMNRLDQYSPRDLDILYLSLRGKSLKNNDDVLTREYLEKVTLVSLEKTLADLNIKKDGYVLSHQDNSIRLEIQIPGPESRTLNLIHYSDKLWFKCEIYQQDNYLDKHNSGGRLFGIIKKLAPAKDTFPDNLICYLHLEGPPYSALSETWTLAQLPVETMVKMEKCLTEGKCPDYSHRHK